jgi:hypothetical protein
MSCPYPLEFKASPCVLTSQVKQYVSLWYNYGYFVYLIVTSKCNILILPDLIKLRPGWIAILNRSGYLSIPDEK